MIHAGAPCQHGAARDFGSRGLRESRESCRHEERVVSRRGPGRVGELSISAMEIASKSAPWRSFRMRMQLRIVHLAVTALVVLTGSSTAEALCSGGVGGCAGGVRHFGQPC